MHGRRTFRGAEIKRPFTARIERMHVFDALRTEMRVKLPAAHHHGIIIIGDLHHVV
ncbi:hypothetical protein D3C87_2081640 [compost metagenome]